MSSHFSVQDVYRGVATILFRDGKTEEYEVHLWRAERVTDRPVLGQQRVLPREDVLGMEGEILTPLHPSKLAEFSFAEQLHLQYGEDRWKIAFKSSSSPRFRAWGHTVEKQTT